MMFARPSWDEMEHDESLGVHYCLSKPGVIMVNPMSITVDIEHHFAVHIRQNDREHVSDDIAWIVSEIPVAECEINSPIGGTFVKERFGYANEIELTGQCLDNGRKMDPGLYKWTYASVRKKCLLKLQKKMFAQIAWNSN